jgi:hypothetical protein
MSQKYIYFEFNPYLINNNKIYNGRYVSLNIKNIVKWYNNPKRNILHIHLPEKYKNTNLDLYGYKNTIYGRITKNKFVIDNIDFLIKIIIDPDDDGNYPIKINCGTKFSSFCL